MIFKTWLSDINKVALAMDGLKGIQIAGTIDKLSTKSLNAFVKGIDGLTLSQAQAALSTKALTDKQKEQILVSAGLLKTSESITASEIKQTVTENILTTEKQQEILATFELEMSEGKLNLERLEAIALEDTEAGAMARVILAKKKENAQNLKNIASGKSLLTVLKGQLTALATNPLTWAIGAFAGITAVALKSAEAIEKVREKASELGNEFSTSKSDIDGYKTQIEDLYKTINDNNSSVEDITTARQTLMTVQDELIDKFGKEKETIDLVTDAINGQSSALDTLTQKKWQETKNKFNESDFWTGVGNWSQGYESNIDRMVDEMENPVVRIGMSVNDFESGEYTEVIQQMEKLGWTYSNTLSAFTKDGSLEDLYEEILNIQNTIDENAPAHFLKELTTEANKAKATLDSYGSMWGNYILNDKIFADDNLADSWKEVNDAYTKYQNAVASGDKTAIDEATSGFATSINEVLNAENVSDSVKDYFKDMYPALYREVEKWEFKTNIIPEFDTKGLNGKTQADILEMLQTDGAQDGEDVFNSIVDSAIKYGLILDDDTEGIQKILDLLVEWGILQGTISDVTSDFANKTTSLLGITETTEKINSEFKPVFDDLKTAYQDIFSLDDNGNRVFDLSNVDIDTLFSIKSAIDSMNEIDGVNIATETYEEFAKVLTDTSSTAEDVQEQFDNLVSELLNQSNIVNLGMNTDVLRQTLEQLGVTNVDEVLKDVINAERELIEYGIELESITNDQIEAFMDEANASDIAKQYLEAYVIQKTLANENALDTTEDLENLESLCESLGTTGEMIEQVTHLKYLFSTLENSDHLPTSELAKIDQQVAATQNRIREIANKQYSADLLFKDEDFEYSFDGLKDEVDEFNKSTTESGKSTAETFDHIETLISRIQRSITNLGKTVSATYKKWSTRNNALAQEMQMINAEIDVQQKAYNAYMAKANSIPLPESYKELVRNGAYSIQDITDDTLREQIEAFKEYYEKALDCTDVIEDLRAELADLAKTKFDGISTQYDNLISQTNHYTSMLEGYVDQAETAGYMASEVYYKAMAEKQEENISQLQNKYSSLLTAFDEAVKNGSIEKYSDDWYDMLESINDVELELQDATTQLIEFNQTLQQLSWDVFDRIQDSVSGIISEGRFLTEILSLRDLHSDKGVITDEGLAVQGLHAVNYNTYMEQAIAYAEEMARIEEEMANDPYDLELVDRRNELIELQQEAIANSIKEKESIVDLISNGYNKMLESLDKLISKRKELLNSQKD